MTIRLLALFAAAAVLAGGCASPQQSAARIDQGVGGLEGQSTSALIARLGPPDVTRVLSNKPGTVFRPEFGRESYRELGWGHAESEPTYKTTRGYVNGKPFRVSIENGRRASACVVAAYADVQTDVVFKVERRGDVSACPGLADRLAVR